jgi:hypothetical protein
VQLALANPGPEPVRVRLTALSARRPAPPRELEVPPGNEVRVEVPALAPEASTYAEFFGGWVAAGWVAQAEGQASGVAAEPCLPGPAGRFLLPDGNTERGEETALLVMNPFAADAVLTITLLTEEGAPVTTKEWSDVVLPAHRSAIFAVNEVKLGERTVSAVVDVGVGRVGAASLGFTGEERRIRSVVGATGLAARAVLPGWSGTGQSELILTNPAGERNLRVAVSVLGPEGARAAEGLEEVEVGPSSAITAPVPVEGPSALDVQAEAGGPGLAAARRIPGVSGDPAAIGTASPAGAWVVLPTVAGRPSHPRLVLANPGAEPIAVRLQALPPPGSAGVPAPVTVEVPARATVSAPGAFVEALPGAAVLAVAEEGTFLAASASTSLGREGLAGHAAALGVAVPARWVSR